MSLKLFAAQSNIQELWEELERTMMSSKSWKGSGVVELDWPGMNRALELRAAIEYKAELEAGDDGRPAWHARKSCNYITSAVEVRDS